MSQNSYVYTITNRPLPSVPRRQQPWLIALVVCTKPKVFTHLLASIQAVDFHCPRALPRPCASKAKPCYLRPLHAVFFHRHPHSSRDTTSSLKPQGLLMSVAGRETGRGTATSYSHHLDQHTWTSIHLLTRRDNTMEKDKYSYIILCRVIALLS